MPLPRLRPLAATLAMTAAAVTLSACGSTEHVTRTITVTGSSGPPTSTTSSSSSPSSSSTSSGTSNSTATTSATTTTAAASSLRGRSPGRIVDLAAAALADAGGYAMHADLIQNGTRSTIQMTSTGPTTFNAQTSSRGVSTDIIRIGSATYLKGNRGFWSHQRGSAAEKKRNEQLAGHWITVPAATRSSVNGSLGTLAPDDLARCLREDHGTLTIAGTETIAGQKALIVKDAGDAPGSTPSTIAVADSGTPYPLRYDATGATRRGGTVDVCNNGKGGGAQGTIDLSQFGRIGQITRPTGASAGGGSAV